MRCWRKLARCPSALLCAALVALWIALAVPASGAYAQGIEVKRATVSFLDDAVVLEAEFDIALTHPLEEVLSKGVPVPEMGRRIFDLILRVASGEQSKSEELGYGDNEFTPWQIGATM